MLHIKLLFWLVFLGCLTNVIAQSISIQNTTSSTQLSVADSIQSLSLITKIKVTTKSFSGVLNKGIDEFTYTIAVKNNNDITVMVVLGGLVYGHYVNCIGKKENFIQEDYIKEKKVLVPARSNTTVKVIYQRKSTPPAYCAGVPYNQQAKVVYALKAGS